MPSARKGDAKSKVEDRDSGDAGKEENRDEGEVEVVKQEIESIGEQSESVPADASEPALVVAIDDEDAAKADVKEEADDAVAKVEIAQDAGLSADVLAALGSAEDIAAAAMQSAGLGDILGDGANDEASRGIKRAREETESTEVNAETTLDPTVTVNASTAPEPREVTSSDFDLPPSTLASADAAAVAALTPIKEGEGDHSLGTSAAVTANESPLDLGDLDLHAVAQAAMGLDADGNPLPGNEESHRALAEAVKQLSAAQNNTGRKSGGNDSDEGDDGRGGGDGPAKKFQCHLCERRFARAYNLNTHIATHDPDPSRSKPFPCPYPSCRTDGGRSFSRKHDLQRHVASTHDGEPEPAIESVPDGIGLVQPGRKFRCDDCGRSFVRRDALKRHQCTKSNDGNNSSNSIGNQNTPAYSRPPPPDYLTNVAAGLSLYTSNTGPASTKTTSKPVVVNGVDSKEAEGASTESNPFGPNGITYENLSEEVQNMAMQLVAQAQQYNDQNAASSSAVETEEGKAKAAEGTAAEEVEETKEPEMSTPSVSANAKVEATAS